MRKMPLTRILLVGAVCCCAGSAQAAGRVSVTVGRAEFAGLVIEDLDADWSPNAAGGAVSVHVARIRGIEATGPLSGFALDCPALRIKGDELHCERGRLFGSLGRLGVQDTRFSARKLRDGSLKLDFASFSIAEGRGRTAVTLKSGRWTIYSTLTGLDVAKFAAVAKPWFSLPADFSVAGDASATVKADGNADKLSAADLDVALARLDFSDSAGTLAGEALAGRLVAHASGADGGFEAEGTLALTGGQAYSEPVFLDFGAHHADLRFAGLLAPEAATFRARDFALVHHDVLEANGSATLDFDSETLLTDARAKIARLDVANALPVYVQPFLIDTALKDLDGAGTVSGEIEIADGLPTRASFVLQDVAIDSPTGAVSVAGLGGRLNWFDDASRTALAGTIDDALFESRVSWQSAGLWGIEIGPVELPFATTGRHFRLLEPKLLPIFDGGLEIGTFRVRHAGTEQMYVRFDAELQPISVAPLARAFGWPEFQGTLSGSIPDLQFSQGVVTTGGNLEATVFDGRVVVRELELRDPLGQYPRLHASIDVDNLDLRLLTNTFSFGMITGRLSGRMEDLETFAWMPVSFDAIFETPPGDRSKHRISQRAVKNLSSIGGGSGGGVAAALQGGLLRFFDDFGYERLGLSCRLANDVCIMGGVEPAGAGYYIVKGAGLPRINVIGSQTRVAWTRLVRQLASIMESEIVVQ